LFKSLSGFVLQVQAIANVAQKTSKRKFLANETYLMNYKQAIPATRQQHQQLLLQRYNGNMKHNMAQIDVQHCHGHSQVLAITTTSSHHHVRCTHVRVVAVWLPQGSFGNFTLVSASANNTDTMTMLAAAAISHG